MARKGEVLSDEEPAPALTQVLGPTGADGWWHVSMAGKIAPTDCHEQTQKIRYKVGLKETAGDTCILRTGLQCVFVTKVKMDVEIPMA